MDGADWLRTQLTSFGCAACGEPYDAGRIRLLAERDGLFFVDLSCTACASRAVAIVTVESDDDEGVQTHAGELAEPTPVLRAVATPVQPPISADDVLDVHRLLDGFEGGTVELMALLAGTPAP